MKRILAVAPHPDDETLGCGGVLCRHRDAGDEIHWMIVTAMTPSGGFTRERIAERAEEIAAVAQAFRVHTVHEMGFQAASLDHVPAAELVGQFGSIFQRVAPNTIYLPYAGDAHSDHAAVFAAASACTKWFRYPSVQRVLVYETPSETDFGIDPDANGFRPTVFANIEEYIEEKIQIMRTYASELGEAPFPRSEAVMRALATVRGAASGVRAAEAFMLLRERI